jgi:hypothetical protein
MGGTMSLLYDAGMAMFFIGIGLIVGSIALHLTWARPPSPTHELPEAISTPTPPTLR